MFTGGRAVRVQCTSQARFVCFLRRWVERALSITPPPSLSLSFRSLPHDRKSGQDAEGLFAAGGLLLRAVVEAVLHKSSM